MPRYLGVNYWQKMIDQRQEFYSCALLTVPMNCNQREPYSSIQDREADLLDQWELCKSIGLYFGVEDISQVSMDMKIDGNSSPWRSGISSPESWFAEEHQLYSGMVEVIPSSNPDSVISSESDDVLTSYGMEDDMIEHFEKEDPKNYQFYDDNKGLEDIVTSDGLREIRSNIPKIPQLTCRLQPKPVKDPLADDAGTQFNEATCFRGHLKLYHRNESDKWCSESSNLNDNDKFDLTSENCELEEVLSPPRKPDGVNSTYSMIDIKANVELLIKCETEYQVENTDSLKLESETSMICALEEPEVTNTTEMGVDFLSVNKQTGTRDDMFIKSAILDTPLLKQTSSVVDRIVKYPYIDDLVQDLQPFPIQMETSALLFLRQIEMENLLTRVRQHEKIFDEILSLRIPEPEINDEATPNHIAVDALIKKLAIVEECGLGSVELKLGWEPWVNSRQEKNTAGFMEPCQFDGYYLDAVDFLEVETFKTLSQDQLSESDEVLGTSRNNEISREAFEKNKVQECEELTRTEFSALDEFMMMRSFKQKKEGVENKEGVMKKHDDPDVQQTFKEQHPETKALNNRLDVEFKGKYKQVLLALQVLSNPYIYILKQAGEIPNTASVIDLKQETTGFLIKQREKQMKDQEKDITDDVYKSLVVVYAVSVAADLLVHCCLESAITHLGAIHEKHNTTLSGCLDEIRKQLFQFKVDFDETNTLHPKVASLCRNVQDVIDGDKGKKVLIVLKRNLSSLVSCIHKTLSMNGNISIFAIKRIDKETSLRMEKHNCIIICEDVISDEMKFSMFDVVLEYEHGSPFLAKKCQDENINFLSLSCDCSRETMDKSEQTSFKACPAVKVTVVCAQSVTNQKHLLQLMESRHNIAIMERKYDEENKWPTADIIIDERHCIVLHKITAISEDWQVEHLSRKLASLGLQYTYCWLIFNCVAVVKETGCILSNSIVTNIGKMEAALANLNRNQQKFQIFYKMLLTYSPEQLAEVVRRCCDVCVETSAVWTPDEWCREWITAEASQEEKFLTCIPCLSSFSAQLLLSKNCLGSLLSYSFAKLMANAPQLPEKVLLMFYKMANCDTGLHLRSGDATETDQFINPNEIEKDIIQNDDHTQFISNIYRANDSGERNFRHADLHRCVQRRQQQIHQQLFKEDCIPQFELNDATYFSQDGEDANIANVRIPNQYVVAELEGMASSNTKMQEFTDVPDFDIIQNTDCLHSVWNDTESGTKSDFDRTDILAGRLQSLQNKLSSTNSYQKYKPFKTAKSSKVNELGYQAEIKPIVSHKPNNAKYFPGRSNKVSCPEVNFLDREKVSMPSSKNVQLRASKDSINNTLWTTAPQSNVCKPVLNEHFQCGLLMPPVQRVSIGLAQPLRRNLVQPQQTQQPVPETQAFQRDTRWSTMDSPPMDLKSDSPSHEHSYHLLNSHLVPEHDYIMRKYGLQHKGGILGWHQNGDFPNKRKKLSYKTLPGQCAGQTVLTFK